MFDEYKDGSLMNCYFLDDVYIDEHDKTRVIFVRVNGSKKVEVYESEEEASQRVTTIKSKLLS